MDCRTSLPLALSLTLCCLGCVAPPSKRPTNFAETMPAPLGKQGAAEAPPPQPAAAPMADNKKPKKTPKASTCVAGANLQVAEADNAKLTNQQKEELYDRGRKGYQQALEIDPNCVPAYVGLGRLYIMIGQHEKAVATFQAGLQKQPKTAELWFQLGACHARKKDWAPAVQCLRKANEFEPENRSCTNTLGLCLAVAGRQDEALDILMKSVGPAQGHFWMARLCLYLNQEDRCKEHLRLALQADANLSAAREMLSQMEAPPSAAAAPVNRGVDLGFEPIP